MLKKQPTYNDEFKKQIVSLFNSGKSATEIADEYKISKTSLYDWKKRLEKSSSFKTKDNRSDHENELIKLRKEIKQLLMENDILKQAALILARK